MMSGSITLKLLGVAVAGLVLGPGLLIGRQMIRSGRRSPRTVAIVAFGSYFFFQKLFGLLVNWSDIAQALGSGDFRLLVPWQPPFVIYGGLLGVTIGQVILRAIPLPAARRA
jgi:hypothetical protein